MAGEDDGPVLVEPGTQAEASLVGLPAKDPGVNCLGEGGHAVEPGGGRAGGQPVEITVKARDETIRTRPDVDDDLSPQRHGLAR
jgi:hypothetical protein